jgi:O-antigen ligase
VALSFTAGFQRTKEQWIRGLIWICSCILPLLVLSLAAGDKLIEGTSSFSGFNINKLGFLAGLLTVLAYGWLRQAKSIANKGLATAALGFGITEAMLTQSRASLAVPLLAIIVDLAISRRWTLKQLLVTGALCVALASGAIYNWYFHTGTTYNLATDYRLGELNRAETIQCWFQTTASSSRGTWLGLGYGKPAQNQCGPERIPSLRTMEKSQGLQHAHNFYAQIFTETGIGGLILAAGITLTGFHQAWKQHNRATLAFTLPLMIYLTLMALGITYWQVMMINQVLVGYSLAALTATDRDPSAADAATPAAPPGAGAPQG